MRPSPLILSLFAGAGALTTAYGAPENFEATFQVDQAIPDGSLTGLADTREVVVPPVPIASLTVTLTLTPIGEGGFTGDLYATLRYDAGGYAVLLNRPGRRPDSAFGYSDGSAINITLADAAPADIHSYRLPLTGSEDVPLGGGLTGSWQPDGRAVDPLAVQAGDSRDARLDSFTGLTPAGNWTLFIADLGSGGGFELDSWGISFVPIPEPPASALLAFVILGLWRLRSVRNAPPGSSRTR